MVLFRITENEPSKMHNVRPYVYSRPWVTQLFTLRLLIEMAKKIDCTLYIGCFVIEKAFDKVSRFLLLKKLIKCGIGFVMFNALKSIYSNTTCILNFNGKNS